MALSKDRIAALANSKTGWALITRLMRLQRKIDRLLRFARRHHALGQRTDQYAKIQAEFADHTIRRGPFAGLRYGNLVSRGSTLLPKLLGSYENELHPVLEDMATREYATVLDVGCAEGYYAVGLARLMPTARVFAYDIEASSRESCRQLAQANDVLDRITIGTFCSPETLSTFEYTGRSLIISDCEGYEQELFTPAVITHLAGVDLIIECHDHIRGAPITRTLTDAFAKTHEATVIQTLPDHRKALDLNYPELEDKPYPLRMYMVEEQREAPQNFLILTAKHSA